MKDITLHKSVTAAGENIHQREIKVLTHYKLRRKGLFLINILKSKCQL